MKKALIILLFLFSCLSSVAFGFVIGSSNFPLGDYPAFRSSVPSRPFSRDPVALTTYRYEVESYVSAAEKYIEACKNDIQRIIESAEKAKRDANSAVNEYNLFVR